MVDCNTVVDIWHIWDVSVSALPVMPEPQAVLISQAAICWTGSSIVATYRTDGAGSRQ